MSITEARQKAEVTYAWFEALDSHAAERTELLAAGVPAHTATALYPHYDFSSAAMQLASRVNSIDIRLLAAKKPITLRRQRQALVILLNALPMEFEERRTLETNGFKNYQAEIQPLADALSDQFGKRALGQTALSTCCSMLWHVWWLASHRGELTPELRVQLDAIVSWVGANVLKLA